VVELIPESYCERLNLPKIFGRTAPLDVDLGCGDGAFLLALAERMPAKNFLGIERMAHRVAKACRKAAKISNMRVLHLETKYAVEYLLPPHSVEVFHLLFPDPWPKRRHWRRRTVTRGFLEAIWSALLPNGVLRIATDDGHYFSSIRTLVEQSRKFTAVEMNGEFPPSTFERRFREQNVEVYRLALRKVSPVT
jgi:tRNA (guanine-N7-)-methyltransferase